MLDLETLAQNFSAPLQSYCGISQIIGGSGNPPEQLITPRIIWSIKEPYIPAPGMPVTSWRKVTGTIDPEHFPYDIQKTTITNPTAVFTLILYGEQEDINNALYIQKAREWFATPFLGPDFLGNYDVVVTDISEIKYSSIQAGSNLEGRGFDVTMRFNEKVSTVIGSIEHAIHNGTIKT